MLRKLVLSLFFGFLLLFLLSGETIYSQGTGSCNNRVDCPFENFPYCERVLFGNCTDPVRQCWEGRVDERGYVDCAYTYPPSPAPPPLPSATCGHEGEPCCSWPQVACQDPTGRLSCIAGRCLPSQCEETVPYECSDCNLSVEPGAGDTGTIFTLSLYCLDSADCPSGVYFLLEYEVNPTEGGIIPELRFPDTINHSVCGKTKTLVLGATPVQGTYTVRLRSTYGPYIHNSLGNPITANFTVEGEGQLECGQPIAVPTANCPYNCPAGWNCLGYCGWYCNCGLVGQGCCPETAYGFTSGYPPCSGGAVCLGGTCVIPLEMLCEDYYGITTAIGCIPIDIIGRTVEFFLNWSVGLSGGVALGLIAFSGILLLASSGHPERIKAAKELLVSVITGVILIIFSIFLLRVVGINILGLPGFG